jgi:hypothetical protein
MPTFLPSFQQQLSDLSRRQKVAIRKGPHGLPQRARLFDFFRWRALVFLVRLTKCNQICMLQGAAACALV